MARYRKPATLQLKHGNNKDTSSSSSSSEVSVGTRTSKWISRWTTAVGVVCLSVAVYVCILGYLETRVNTPFDYQKLVQQAGLATPERYWGSYRPGVYMGMRSREFRSPLFGLMWYQMNPIKGIRHWCDQNDNLPTYGWLRHDGLSFGEQVIVDPPHTLTTSFIKSPGGDHGGHWTVRINVTAVGKREPLNLVWYYALDEGGAECRAWVEGGALVGHTPALGNYKMHIHMQHGKVLHRSYSEAHVPGPHVLKEKFLSLLWKQSHGALGTVVTLMPDEEVHEKDKYINFIPFQLTVETPSVVDIVFMIEDQPTPPLQGDEYTRVLEYKKRSFDQEFEVKFKLAEKGYSEDDVSIARAAMSNMIGGIGYFFGASRVVSAYTKEPVPYWRAPLYTAVPSRSFFPRGFLWDEGFHGLLIGRWSPDIFMDIVSHWLDLMNVEGWIPREQILGPEALARVPKEFVVQSNAAANPPMLLITLATLIKNKPRLFVQGSPHRAALDRMFDRLQAWFQWFQNTQKGYETTSYRWRGREDDGIQLNPKSLSSGLDDYPRASHPSYIERHLDLRCWMFAAADAMATVASTLNADAERAKFEAIRDQLGDEDLLNELHWSPETETYADYGLHTDEVRLIKVPPRREGEEARVVRSVTLPPEPRLVTSAFGYVSLFPMLLKVLQPESDKLGKILEKLEDPDLLWSPYGLRSLSKSSPWYMKRNTEHDPPYWRGQVWANMNHLALAALRHYAGVRGPHRERAGRLHARLRHLLVSNILNEYKRTGYLWEQYSAEDGKGSGCKPFTGWTALVTLMMAEEY